MNLAEIRTRIFNQIDWAPTTSSEAVTRTNGFINRAYEQLCLEAPFCFFESEVKLSTLPDVLSNDECSTANGINPIPFQVLVPVIEASGIGIADRLIFGPQTPSMIATQRNADEQFDTAGVLPVGANTTQDTNESIRSWGPNPWVLTWNFAASAALWQQFVAAGGVVPPIDGSWDGRNIDLYGPDGKWHTNRIREVWFEAQAIEGLPDMLSYWIVLWNPFPIEQFDYSTTTFKYRVYTENYYFPDDMIKAHSVVINDDQRTYPVDIILQEEAEQFSLTDHFEMASGIPSVAYRRSHFQLPAPNTAPIASLNVWESSNIHWHGPEPAGTFSYLVTYCIGSRNLYNRNPGPGMFDEDYTNNFLQNGRNTFFGVWPYYEPTTPGETSGNVVPWHPSSNRFREPLWESAPSPISSLVTVRLDPEGGVGTNEAVTLQVPNIAFMLGMLGSGLYEDDSHLTRSFRRPFADHCGVRIRIYRRRHTQDWTNYEILRAAAPPHLEGATYTSLEVDGALQAPSGHIEISDAYYLLAEMQVTDSNRGIYIDDGQVHPDYNRRLRDVHGYQSMGLYPIPDKTYNFKVRCLRRPPKLIDDQDVPLVHAEACNALIDLAASYWYEAEGVPEMARQMRERYDRGIFDLKKRYGNLQSQANPHLKRLSRAKAGFRRTRPLRKWWTLP